MRKLVGLSESTERRVAAIGQQLQGVFSGLQDAIYTARELEAPPGSLASANATAIDTLRHTCERHRDDPHAQLRAVVREFLLDWEVILRPLSDPWLPLSRVEMWRGGLRSDLSVAASFVWRCLTSLAITPFPHPARQTGRADRPHPAFFRPSGLRIQQVTTL
jgi:hypothetical protein